MVPFEGGDHEMRAFVITDDRKLHEHGFRRQVLRSCELLRFDHYWFLSVLCHCGILVVVYGIPPLGVEQTSCSQRAAKVCPKIMSLAPVSDPERSPD